MKKNNKFGLILTLVVVLIIGAATPVFADDIANTIQVWVQRGVNGKEFKINALDQIITQTSDGDKFRVFMIEDEIYAPVKTLSEALGKKVTYDPEDNIIYINHNNYEMPGQRAENAKLTTAIVDNLRVDSLDYKFTLDKEAVGEWKTYYYYGNINDFTPSLSPAQKRHDWSGVSVYEDGTFGMHLSNKDIPENIGTKYWTKGYFVNPALMSGIPAYSINNIDGKTFMFVEWKNDEYARGQDPGYYVFEKISDTPKVK